jgi:UDP-N-acetylglucosamine transferase subunit ALG13
LQKLNYQYINRFTQCWIPDNENENNLAGELSHPSRKPYVPTKYIGPLSRFQRDPAEEKHLLIILSGPEPQRTTLENLLVHQLKEYEGPVVLVRGLPGEENTLDLSSNICVFNHLPAGELNQKMDEAFLVISRCGYSTVMDIVALQKKSVLIPTPGQTEQEYLGKHLMKKNFALCVDQKKFTLKNALELADVFNYQVPNFSSENYLEDVLNDFIASLKFSSKSAI